MSERAERFYQSMFNLWNIIAPDLFNSAEVSVEDKSEDPPENPCARTARQFLEALAGRHPAEDLPEPFRSGVPLIHDEYRQLESSRRRAAFDQLEALLGSASAGRGEAPVDKKLITALQKAFFPEALYLDDDPQAQIPKLRRRRQVKITQPAEHPVTSPSEQIIFTSNVLLSPPLEAHPDSDTGIDEETAQIIRRAAETSREPQLYWYDHPVPIGVPPSSDEVLHGLRGLSEALEFEVTRGDAGVSKTLRICLSVSVTHKGLHGLARPWLKARLAAESYRRLEGIEAYAFTEADTDALVDLLVPWLPSPADEQPLRAAFGVDGEYGRHYSFLKALPALWSVLLDPQIKAVFKIDLDQVFPQALLSRETGRSAFKHFTSPLWGALASDEGGRPVELGMIAGGLVNEKDTSSGLFTPDIPWPEYPPGGENLIFFKQLPMAVSTRAEITARYGDPPDGVGRALQRIHVTGGTSGIRLDALRRHRPFTPSFVGRAEDQAYLLSVLQPPENSKLPALRYLHASGLIMRHDKDVFAGGAVKAGKSGSYVGDLVRLFVFSAYAGLLPGGHKSVKSQVDPFTGCFITPIPATLALLQLALHICSRPSEGSELLALAARRLEPWVCRPSEKQAEIKAALTAERRAWNAYYDALDKLEAALAEKDPAALETARLFRARIEACRITG